MLLLLVATLSFLLAFGLDMLADQLTQRIAIIGPYVGLTLTHNPGIAYGLRIPSPWQEVLIIGALALVTFAALREAESKTARIAFGMIIGGACANLLDRALDGLVTDYIQVGTFYIFNAADSLITIGIIILLLGSLRKKKSE